jgi:hypothetical protein
MKLVAAILHDVDWAAQQLERDGNSAINPVRYYGVRNDVLT